MLLVTLELVTNIAQNTNTIKGLTSFVVLSSPDVEHNSIDSSKQSNIRILDSTMDYPLPEADFTSFMCTTDNQPSVQGIMHINTLHMNNADDIDLQRQELPSSVEFDDAEVEVPCPDDESQRSEVRIDDENDGKLGDDDDDDTDDEIAEAEAIDAEFPDGEAFDWIEQPLQHKIPKSSGRCYNPVPVNTELQEMMERTETILEQLSMKAQAHIERQPFSTQIILNNAAKEKVFAPYGRHGSQAQFSESVLKFLNGGNTIRKPGKAGLDKAQDGILRFAPLDPAVNMRDNGNDSVSGGKLKRKVAINQVDPISCGSESDRVKLRLVNAEKRSKSVTQAGTNRQRHRSQRIRAECLPIHHDHLLNESPASIERRPSDLVDWEEHEA